MAVGTANVMAASAAAATFIAIPSPGDGGGGSGVFTGSARVVATLRD
jgi:hypothetical protein